MAAGAVDILLFLATVYLVKKGLETGSKIVKWLLIFALSLLLYRYFIQHGIQVILNVFQTLLNKVLSSIKGFIHTPALFTIATSNGFPSHALFRVS